MVALGKTCPSCEACEIIVAAQLAIADLIAELFKLVDLGVIGHEYLVLGTPARTAWRQRLFEPMAIDARLQPLAGFEGYLEIEFAPSGRQRNKPARPQRRKK